MWWSVERAHSKNENEILSWNLFCCVWHHHIKNFQKKKSCARNNNNTAVKLLKIIWWFQNRVPLAIVYRTLDIILCYCCTNLPKEDFISFYGKQIATASSKKLFRERTLMVLWPVFISIVVYSIDVLSPQLCFLKVLRNDLL